jgi:FYVE/RhoGEF/PH domain-containing protein 5/6
MNSGRPLPVPTLLPRDNNESNSPSKTNSAPDNFRIVQPVPISRTTAVRQQSVLPTTSSAPASTNTSSNFAGRTQSQLPSRARHLGPLPGISQLNLNLNDKQNGDTLISPRETSTREALISPRDNLTSPREKINLLSPRDLLSPRESSKNPPTRSLSSQNLLLQHANTTNSRNSPFRIAANILNTQGLNESVNEEPPKNSSEVPRPSDAAARITKSILPSSLKEDPRNVNTEEEFDKLFPLEELTWDSTKWNGIRDKIVYETYTTERTYITQLRKVSFLYRLPILNAYNNGFPSSLQKLERMFAYITELLQVNNELYSNLLQRLKNWNNSAKIADVFIKLAPFFKLYTQYTESYNDVINVVKEEKNKDSTFSGILDQAAKHPIAKNLDLQAFLILPVQRIPRYVLLLTDLIRNTPEDHPDYVDLQRALKAMKTVADHIEEFIAGAENREKCLAIQNSFDQFLQKEVEIIKPHRRFLFEGTLVKQCRKERKDRRFFLFNDCLIYATVSSVTGKYMFSGEIPLSELLVSDIPDDGQSKFTLKFESRTKSFLAYATSAEDKTRWLLAITSALSELERKKKIGNLISSSSTLSDSGTVKAKLWVPDTQVTNCYVCNHLFTLLVRKHHCRNCGEVVCATCSKKKMTLPTASMAVRVCIKCYSTKVSETIND